MKNKKNSNKEFSLTDEQFWLLASAFGPTFMIGFKNPYLGWLAEEIKEAQQKTIQSLIDAEWAQWDKEDDSLEVDEDLYNLVKACIKPRHSLMVNPTDKNTQGKFFYFDDRQIVFRIVMNHQNHLQVLDGTKAIKDLLADDLCQTCKIQSHLSPITISEETLKSLTSLTADDLEAAKQTLDKDKKDISAKDQQRLLTALTKTVANSSFVTVFNQDNLKTQHTAGFGILEGEQDLFLLESKESMGKSMVEIHGVDARKIMERFEQILPVNL